MNFSDFINTNHEPSEYVLQEEDPVTTLVFDDAYRQYMAGVNARADYLSHEEETKLLTAYINNNDMSAFDRIVKAYQVMIIKLSSKYSFTNINQMDLIQEGNMGLMKAITKFNPDISPALAPIAKLYVKDAIRNYVFKNWSIVPIAESKPRQKIFTHIYRLTSGQLLPDLTPKDYKRIAQELEVSEDDVAYMVSRLSNQETVALDITDDEEASSYPMSLRSAFACYKQDPYEVLNKEREEFRDTVGLWKALKQLDPKYRDIIMTRYLSDSNSITPFQHLAEKYEVSIERIRQLEVKAFKQLKELLAEYA